MFTKILQHFPLHIADHVDNSFWDIHTIYTLLLLFYCKPFCSGVLLLWYFVGKYRTIHLASSGLIPFFTRDSDVDSPLQETALKVEILEHGVCWCFSLANAWGVNSLSCLHKKLTLGHRGFVFTWLWKIWFWHRISVTAKHANRGFKN